MTLHSFRFTPLIGYIGLLIFSLFLSEASLSIASWFSVSVRRILAPPWDVARASFPGNPLHPGHDEWGYRNSMRPTTVDIVTLGDSQTYGTGVADTEPWPSVLSASYRTTVYNMALPGLGPAHSLLQLDEALSLKPRTIVLALYMGNDFYDSFAIAPRIPDLANGVAPALRNAAESIERRSPLGNELGELHPALRQVPVQQRPGIVRQWLSEHVKVYGLLRFLRFQLNGATEYPTVFSRNFTTVAEDLSPLQRAFYFPVQDGKWRTILTPPYRAAAVNDDDPRIRMGFQVSILAIDSIVEKCLRYGVKILVVLIPTKESVFWPHVTQDVHPALHQLVRNEERLKKELIAHLRERLVVYIDLLEPLQHALVQPYFEDGDSHPNTIGHRIIAQEIAKRIVRD